MAAKSSKAPKKSAVMRKRELEEDEWSLEVKSKSILCKGCNTWKELHRPYELNNWIKHKKVCMGITGRKKVRVWNPAPRPVKPVNSFNDDMIMMLK